MVERKKTPIHIAKKMSKAGLVFWIILGFLSGSLVGHLIYQESDEDVIKLTLVYSSEKSQWISESQTLFYEYWDELMKEDPSLKPIQLDFQPYGSGDSLIALLNGEIKPTLWSPASNIWIPMLNAKWSAMTDDDTPFVENYTRLIYSPVVIAAWENFLNDHPFDGLGDLHDIIKNNPGLVKMAHTDPRASNSGFMATVMMVSGRLGMDPADITMDNISDSTVTDWMREFESAAIFYGKSTGFLGKYMRDQGPGELQIAILYENLVQDYSKAAEEKYGQKLVAVYPEEGALFSDHPFCQLNADWVTPEQKMVASKFLEFLGRDEILVKAIESGFRPINNSILDNPDIHDVYSQSFNEDHGVKSDATEIIELLPPTDGHVIARIPDLWLLTRNKV